MDQKNKRTFHQIIRLDYNSENDDIWITSSYTLRRLVGILGMALPVLLYLYVAIAGKHLSPLPSLSHYYFTGASSIFAIIVSLLAIFLIIYKGKEPLDFYLSLSSGIFALCVIIFPTDSLSGIAEYKDFNFVITAVKKNCTREIFHAISAGVFLSGLALMSLFLFPKPDKKKYNNKRNKSIRNKIYTSCGVVMILAMIVIFLGFQNVIGEQFYNSLKLTFWMEVVAIESFGISWLTKGNTIFGELNT